MHARERLAADASKGEVEGAGDAVRPRRALVCMPRGNRARGVTQARVAQRQFCCSFVLVDVNFEFCTSAKTFSGLCVEMVSKHVHISH